MEEQQEIDGLGCRTVLPARLRADGVQAVIDAQPKGREVFLDAGSLLVLDPMTTRGRPNRNVPDPLLGWGVDLYAQRLRLQSGREM